jgi:hypothetical protein
MCKNAEYIKVIKVFLQTLHYRSLIMGRIFRILTSGLLVVSTANLAYAGTEFYVDELPLTANSTIILAQTTEESIAAVYGGEKNSEEENVSDICFILLSV